MGRHTRWVQPRRRHFTTALLVAVLLAAGCGGKQGSKGDSDGVDDAWVTLKGKISRRGSTPYSLLMLEGHDGKAYMIQSSWLSDELRQLDGMEVSVTAKIHRNIGPASDDVPLIDVESYDLLPLASGERPIIGYVRAGGWIEDRNMVTWKLAGDFSDVLLTFVGSKVWVVGTVQRAVNTGGASYRELYVTEYGVIRP